MFIFLFKQKTAYEMLISDWSSDVCSSDLGAVRLAQGAVDVVAELGRLEQKLRARLPVLRRLALGRLQHAGVEELARLQGLHHFLDAAGLDQRALDRKSTRLNSSH